MYRTNEARTKDQLITHYSPLTTHLMAKKSSNKKKTTATGKKALAKKSTKAVKKSPSKKSTGGSKKKATKKPAAASKKKTAGKKVLTKKVPAAKKTIAAKKTVVDPFKISGQDEARVTGLNRPVVKCNTELKVPPGTRPNTRILLDVNRNSIPIWDQNMTLHWRFRQDTFLRYDDPESAMERVRDLLAMTLKAWGKAVPVKFIEKNDRWDFEIYIMPENECDDDGCYLATAFFPNSERNELALYPKLFRYSEREQLLTLQHELGHIFGLRHFFARKEEGEDPSVTFGKNSAFTIMNYGGLSKLTKADRDDLAELYTRVWSGELTKFRGKKFKLVRPHHVDN